MFNLSRTLGDKICVPRFGVPVKQYRHQILFQGVSDSVILYFCCALVDPALIRHLNKLNMISVSDVRSGDGHMELKMFAT